MPLLHLFLGCHLEETAGSSSSNSFDASFRNNDRSPFDRLRSSDMALTRNEVRPSDRLALLVLLANKLPLERQLEATLRRRLALWVIRFPRHKAGRPETG